MLDKISYAELVDVLFYNPDTGVFVWLEKKNNTRNGRVAGSLMAKGRIGIMIDGVTYYAHRLAWLYVYGSWPSDQIDHINGDPTDNRIVNLRVVNYSQNAINRSTRLDNTSGGKGICWDPKVNKWRSRICRDGKRICLGRFDTLEQAHAAYAAAAKIYHGEFARAE